MQLFLEQCFENILKALSAALFPVKKRKKIKFFLVCFIFLWFSLNVHQKNMKIKKMKKVLLKPFLRIVKIL